MVTELFPLKLAFRGLSDDPDGDEVETSSPDADLEDEDEEDDDLPDATDADEADDAGAIEQ
jgi:hypothetical protein